MLLRCCFCDKSFQTEHSLNPRDLGSIEEHHAMGGLWQQLIVTVGSRQVFVGFVCATHGESIEAKDLLKMKLYSAVSK